MLTIVTIPMLVSLRVSVAFATFCREDLKTASVIIGIALKFALKVEG